MPVYLFLPSTTARAPYQPVIMFPELSDWESPDSTERIEQIFPFPEFIVADGRVLVVPVFAGIYERYDGYPALPTTERTDVLVARRMQWIKDIGNVIDYLESREDIDTSSVAYLGISYGGTVALPLLIEPRLTTAVLMAAGVLSFDARGAVPAPGNAINFLPRITLPTLLITGDYDHIIVAEAQALLFDRLGTPDEHKKWVRHPGSHWPFPKNQTVREVLGWLDRYMGKVAR
jgi:dienelactone hydrolase